jgi:hypothetical protein
VVDKKTKQKLKRIWCERLVIGLFASTALGFFVAKIPTVYSQNLANEQAQVQVRKTWKAQVQVLEARKQVRETQKMQDQALVVRLLRLKQTQVQTQEALVEAQIQAQMQAETLQQQFILLGISGLCFILMLLLLLRRNQISLPLTGQLIIVLPEECVVELEAFHQQIKFEKRSAWVIRMIMLWTVLELLWAFHVQINVENLSLPKSKGHNKIDD